MWEGSLGPFWSISLCVLAFFAAVLIGVIHWFFFDTGPGERHDQGTFAGWRDRKAQATSYSDMQEYRDSIDGEDKDRSTRFQRFLRWWRSRR